MIRIGHGYDLHRLEQKPGDNSLRLGGVDVPFEQSFVAHSDGDVVIHAVIDALLGAAALGDIGQHFPDTDPAYKGCNSRDLLANVVGQLKSQKYTIINIDVTIIAQKPKLAPHIPHMKELLSQDLQIGYNDVNLKAKTNERCDAVGRVEAVAVYAVALIQKCN